MAGEISPKLQGPFGQKKEIIAFTPVNNSPSIIGKYGNNCLVIGDSSSAGLQNTLLIGTNIAVPYYNSTASGPIIIGMQGVTLGGTTYPPIGSIGIGNGITVTNQNSVCLGGSSQVNGSGNSYSTAIGYSSTANATGGTAIGFGSNASATYSTAIGYTAASGNYSVALGYIGSGNYSAAGTNTISVGWSQTQNNNQNNCILINSGGGQGSGLGYGSVSNSIIMVTGGVNYTNQQNNSIIMGSQINMRLPGQITMQNATGAIQSLGAAQPIKIYVSNQTTNATQASLYINYSTNTQLITLLTSSINYFKARIIAKNAGANAAGVYEITGAIQVGATAASAAIVGSITNTTIGATSGASTWAVTAVANTSNPSIDFKVTGAASTTINWYAEVELLELIF